MKYRKTRRNTKLANLMQCVMMIDINKNTSINANDNNNIEPIENTKNNSKEALPDDNRTS